MSEELSGHFMVSQEFPEFLVWLAALALFAVWARLQDWRGKSADPWQPSARFALRCILCFAGLFALTQALMRHLVFATDWPLWPLLLGGTLLAELSISLYSLELQTVPTGKARALYLLRAAAILLLSLLLCQPVSIFELSRKIDRHVAILIDASASMLVPDNGMSPAERVKLAESLSLLKTPRILRLEETSASLRLAAKDLVTQNEALKSLIQLNAPGANLSAKGIGPILDTDRKFSAQFSARAKKFSESTPKANLPDIPDFKAKLDSLSLRFSDISAKLEERSKMLAAASEMAAVKDSKDKPDWLKIIEPSRAIAEAMQKLEKDFATLGDELDEAFCKSLPESERKELDSLIGMKRLELAKKLLTSVQGHGELKGKSILNNLADNYGIKAYAFASETAELDEKTLGEKPSRPKDPKQKPAVEDGKSAPLGTNIAAALEKVATDMPPGQLAGVLLLSDGRHNAAEQLDPLARRFGQAKMPICPISFASCRKPPTDASILEARFPDMIYLEDKMQAELELKFDNLAGKKIKVRLMDGDRQADSREIEVKETSVREKLQLCDTPKAVGSHSYKVIMEGVEGEVEPRNNEFAATVNVSDDRLKLLYIEGRPRWEFRYLKNLFMGRDSSVRMQYLLFHPDQLADQPQRQVIPASANRPISEAEATSLPVSDEEWMKFDVIILGDVDPAELGIDAQKAIKKFVEERGGSLVLVAGQNFMPRAYASSVIGELSPVQAKPDTLQTVAAPEESFKIALSSEGAEHPVTKLASLASENAEIWSKLPPFRWRHPLVNAKPGASVLAYAMPLSPPDYLKRKSASEVPDAETQKMRRLFELQNAVLVSQNFGLGKVVLLASDESWRLRYRNGDLYHHKFWGQLLRWAADDKIRFGSEHVRIAAERSRYSTDEKIRVRAKIVKPDFSPLLNAAPLLRVMDGTREIARKNLRLEANSPGVYEAELGMLPEGNYSLELDANGLPQELEGELKAARAGFGVSRSTQRELAELAGDPETLNRLASLSGGLVAEPAQAQKLAGQFGPPSMTQTERKEFSIWNSWIMLLLAVSLLAAEWILRKKVSLP